MTRLLALDTSSWWAGFALVVDDDGQDGSRVSAETGVSSAGSHAGALLDRVDALLSLAGLSRDDLDGYAAVRGPGSFTGVRIGLGTLRGLAVATGRPCYGVDGLAALAAAHGPAACERVVLMDAGRAELFAARYDASSLAPRPLDAVRLVTRDDVPAEFGDGAAVAIPAPGTSLDAIAWPDGWHVAAAPRTAAGAAGLLAMATHLGALDVPRLVQRDDAIEPLYVRIPDAVLNLRRSGGR